MDDEKMPPRRLPRLRKRLWIFFCYGVAAVLATFAAIYIYQTAMYQLAVEDIESRGGAVSVVKAWDSSSDEVWFYVPGLPPKLVDGDAPAIIADLKSFKSLKVVDVRGTHATTEFANAVVNRFPNVEVLIDKRQAQTSIRKDLDLRIKVDESE